MDTALDYYKKGIAALESVQASIESVPVRLVKVAPPTFNGPEKTCPPEKISKSMSLAPGASWLGSVRTVLCAGVATNKTEINRYKAAICGSFFA